MLSVKQRVQMFEAVPRASLPDEVARPTKRKAVYIPKETTANTQGKALQLQTMYHNALRDVMDPLFIFASIYAAIRLITAIFYLHSYRC